MTLDFSTSSGNGRLEQLPSRKAALLLGVYKEPKEKNAAYEHVDELERLADTFGLITIEKMVVPLRKIEAATFIGKGKVKELEELASNRCDVIVFDEEISPQQQRNLEKMTKCAVIDRAELILGVFAQRAQTKEAQIQVQLASFRYQLPRLKRLWTHLERQRTGGGKGGYLKGAGERQIEVDRRLIQSRITRLQQELKVVVKQRQTQRSARKKQKIPLFALVGYTNAGKSTLLNSLTDAKVFTEDKLFATLDTTTRKFTLPNNQEILLIDTVGFIRKLPHQLVAAFKSTLEEASFADIILHVVDSSSENAIEQAEATMQVLQELQIEKKPTITILNKSDVAEEKKLLQLKIVLQNTVAISALQKKGFDELFEKIQKEIASLRKTVKLLFDQKHYADFCTLQREGYIIHSEYEGNNIKVEAEVPEPILHKFSSFQIK